jgi:hypothetical protein
MRYTFEYGAEKELLKVSASGKMDNEASPELFTMFRDEPNKNECYKALIDYRDFTITKFLASAL